MNKISKKEALNLLSNNTSKMVLLAWDRNSQFAKNVIDNTSKEHFEKVVKNIPKRIVVKANNEKCIFEILEGDEKGKKVYLSSLINSNFYTYKNDLGKFIIFEENKGKGDCIAYALA